MKKDILYIVLSFVLAGSIVGYDLVSRPIREQERIEKVKNDSIAKVKRLAKIDSLNKIKLVRIDEAAKIMRKEYDDIDHTTTYTNKYFIHWNNRNLVSAYVITRGSEEDIKAKLQLKMSYAGDSWIFFNTAILSYDGNNKYFFDWSSTTATRTGVDDDVDVYEVMYAVPNDRDIIFLKQLVESPTAKVRFEGEWEYTRKLYPNERKAIRDAINLYEAIEGEITKDV